MLTQKPEKVADQFIVLEDKFPELWGGSTTSASTLFIWSSLPTIVKLFVSLLVASAIILSPIYLMYKHAWFADAEYSILQYIPVAQTNDWIESCRWLIVLEIVVVGYITTKYSSLLVRQFIAFVVKRNHRILSRFAIRLCEIVSLVWTFLCLNCFSTIIWIASLYIMPYPRSLGAKDHGGQYWAQLPWQFFAERFFLIICVSSYLITAEKILLQEISKEFSQSLYRDRIQKCMYSFWALNVLRKAANVFRYTHVSNFSKNFDKLWTTKAYPYASSDLMTTFILENFVKLGKKSGERKQTMAKQIFKFLANPEIRDMLYVDDFRPFFLRSDAEKVFSVFDLGCAGDVSQSEFVKAIDEIYNERGDLIRVLLTNSDVITRLDNFMLVLVAILISFIIFPAIGFSPSEALVPLGVSIGPTIVACTLIFGETVKSILAAIIFLFATHPYDVGDRVYMDQSSYFVRRIGLLSTTFERWDGFTVYIPNSVLATKSICNVRRTALQSQRVELVLPATVSSQSLSLLESRLNTFSQAESRDFASIRCCRYEMRDMNQLALVIAIKHRYNFQDGNERYLRVNKFMKFLNLTLVDLGIAYFTTIRSVELQDLSEMKSQPPV